MKKLCTPCARLARTMRSTSSALRARDLRPCTLMMVQKLHRNGQPRPASKLVRSPLVRRTMSIGRYGTAAPSRPGQIVHEVVERLELVAIGGPQQVFQPPLGLAGEQGDAQVDRLVQLRRQVRQHRDAAADVEAADADRDARGAQRPRDIDGARKLVGLHADQADQPATAAGPDLRGSASLGRMRVLVSSQTVIRISTSSPSTLRCAQSSARP